VIAGEMERYHMGVMIQKWKPIVLCFSMSSKRYDYLRN